VTDEIRDANENAPATTQGRRKGRWSLMVLGAAVLISAVMWWTRPLPERRSPQPRVPLVEGMQLRPTTSPVSLSAYGRVRAVSTVTLRPQIAGVVQRMHPEFVPGGRIPAGETVVALDAREYRLAVRRAEAARDEAKEQLALEAGRRRVARAEWRLAQAAVTDHTSRDLATRGPQWRSRQAQLADAQAALARARLDLARTRLTLPYPAVVERVETSPGSLAQPGTELGRLHAVHAFWVIATLPVADLQWARTHPAAATATVQTAAGTTVVGFVRKKLPDVETDGSLGRILIEVPVASQTDALPLRLGEFVEVSIIGAPLADVYALPREAVHQQTEIWLADAQEQLQIRRIEPLYRGRDYVLVRDSALHGARLVTSGLSTPVAGMQLEVTDTESTAVRVIRR